MSYPTPPGAHVDAASLNLLSQRLTNLGFHVKDIVIDTSRTNVVLWFGDIHNTIDFFESTAIAASKQKNTPILRLSATLGGVQPTGAVTWSWEDNSAVLHAWGIK